MTKELVMVYIVDDDYGRIAPHVVSVVARKTPKHFLLGVYLREFHYRKRFDHNSVLISTTLQEAWERYLKQQEDIIAKGKAATVRAAQARRALKELGIDQ